MKDTSRIGMSRLEREKLQEIRQSIVKAEAHNVEEVMRPSNSSADFTAAQVRVRFALFKNV